MLRNRGLFFYCGKKKGCAIPSDYDGVMGVPISFLNKYCPEQFEIVKFRIWKLTEMEADHVAAWSKAGETTKENCQMLCKTHNRVKGNC